MFAELPSLGFINCASLIGHNNNQEMRTCQMQDTIAKFRDGRVTPLVATSVAEEGLDIRQCNVVIRFDLAKTVLAYIQSRGRARKPGSDYILMFERGNLSHETFLRNARNSEETLRKEAIERTDLSHLKGTQRLVSHDTLPGAMYQVELTGAVVSLNSAVGLIHFYCSQLPSDRYSILRPEFIMEQHENPGVSTEYLCKLQLPGNAPFEMFEGPVCGSMRLAQQAVCLAACKKLHETGAFTDMLLPDKGSREEADKVEQNDEGDPLPGSARHREFYPEGVADILQGVWILSGKDVSHNMSFQLYMYAVKSVNVGASKDPFLTQVSEFAVLFGNQLDAEVLSMSMDLFVARTMITRASLTFRGPIKITGSQLISLKSFHVRLMSIVLDVDVDPLTTPWDPAKAYLFVPIMPQKCLDPVKEIDWDLVESITTTDAWNNPLQRARPDVFLGTNGRALGGDRREYGFGKLRNGMTFGQRAHPTYGIRGAVAKFDVVKASGLVPYRSTVECLDDNHWLKGKLYMADFCIDVKDLVGRIVTVAHSGKRFYIDSVRYEMNAENSFPRKEGHLGPLEYSSYADYYRQKWAAPGVLPIFDEDTKEESELSLFGEECPSFATNTEPNKEFYDDYDYDFVEDPREDGELEADSSCYRVLSSKTLADVVEALIGVYYVEGGKTAANHLMRWVGIKVDFDPGELEDMKPHVIPESILRSIDFEALEGTLNMKFKDRSLLVEAITHASRPSSGVSCYQRLEFVGDAVLDHLITRHLFFTYTDLPPGRLTDLRAAAVNNENFARVSVKHKLHVHLRHGSTALEAQIREFVKDVHDELLKPWFNSFGLGDCKAPKVLGDIVESIAGAIFPDSGRNTSVVWQAFQPLLHPMVTPETLPMHPVRELQERCQQQAEGLEYKATRMGNVATVEVFVDGVQIGVAQNPQKKMAHKLAARNALLALKEKEKGKEIEIASSKKDGVNAAEKKSSGALIFTRQALNDICLRKQWQMPQYCCVNEGGPAHAKRFVYAVRVNTSDRGWTDECIGEPMPSVKKAKDSAAVLLLELLSPCYPDSNNDKNNNHNKKQSNLI